MSIRRFAVAVVAAGAFLGASMGSALAADDPCVELKAGLCEVCGAEACAELIQTEATPEECIEVMEVLDEAVAELEQLGDDAVEEFAAEFCAAIAEGALDDEDDEE